MMNNRERLRNLAEDATSLLKRLQARPDIREREPERIDAVIETVCQTLMRSVALIDLAVNDPDVFRTWASGELSAEDWAELVREANKQGGPIWGVIDAKSE